MVLSRRERLILIVSLTAVGLFAFDQVVLSRLLEARSATAAQRDGLAKELQSAESLIALRDKLDPKWRQMIQGGLRGDSAGATSQIAQMLQFWAVSEGLEPLNLVPEQVSEKSLLPQIAFGASGTGGMRGLARLLWRIQTAEIPIKVIDVTVNARTPGADNLSFLLRLSTVYSSSRGGATTAPDDSAPSATSAESYPPPETPGGRSSQRGSGRVRDRSFRGGPP